MKNLQTTRYTQIFALMFFGAMLTACGGGGGTPKTSTLPITVIDGPLKNAVVCLDKNQNDVCDTGEPTEKTDANGLATLVVDQADMGKYPVVAVVGVDAIDADTGPVATRYVLTAPADSTTVVSPLTTVVQTFTKIYGLTTAQATSQIAGITGLTAAQITGNYIKDASPNGSVAYSIAQALVVANQKQVSSVASAVGANAIDGVVIDQASVDKATGNAAANMLAALTEAVLLSNSVADAKTPAERLAAVKDLITTDFLIANGGITSPAAAKVAVGISNKSKTDAGDASSYTAVAGVNLVNLQFTDSSNWYVRTTQKTLAEATLDSNNAYRYRGARFQNTNGTKVSWMLGSTPARGADLHWNGKAWVSCAINFQNTQTKPDTNGISNYNACDGLSIGTVSSKAPTSASFDVSGQSISTVYTDKIAAANFTNIKVGNGTVEDSTRLLGSAVFPSGSTLSYHTSNAAADAVSFYPGSGSPGNDNTVILPSAIDAAGGDFTSGGTATACQTSTASKTPASDLEALIARTTGTPCKFGAATATGANGKVITSTEGGQTRNESWGSTTLSLGQIGSAPTYLSAINASSYYTSNTRMRVSFGANKSATFYTCLQRYDGSTRNCTSVGVGTYAINTLSDGSRTLTFAGLPPKFSTQGWNRVFVERNNLIYFGYQNLPTTTVSARLNKVATDALFAQLGLNTVSYFSGLNGGVDPGYQIKLNSTAYSGNYIGYVKDNAGEVGVFNLSIQMNGQSSCSYLLNGDTVRSNCTATITPDSADGTVANFRVEAGGATLTGTLSYYTGMVTNGTWVHTAASTSGSFTATRL